MANPSSKHRSTAGAVAHRVEVPTWRFHAALDRLGNGIDRAKAGRRYAKAWLQQPVRASRAVHLRVALGYAAIAVGSGIAVVAVGR